MLSIKVLKPRSHDYLYAGLLALALCLLQVLLRSEDLASDGNFRVALAYSGDLSEPQFGGWEHFLQMPLAYYLHLVAEQFIPALSAKVIYLSFGVIGNFLSHLFLFLVLLMLFQTTWIATVGTCLFGFSPVIWFYWNGETVNLGMGFAWLAIYFSLRGKKLPWIALALAFAALCRIDFALLAPGLIWMERDWDWNRRGLQRYLLRLSALTIATSAITGLILFFSLQAMGVIDANLHSIHQYHKDSLGFVGDFFTGFLPRNVPRSIKGITLTLSPTLNSFLEILRGTSPEPRHWPDFMYSLYFGLFLLFLFLMIRSFFRALRGSPARQHLGMAALAMIVPLQVLFNWRFEYQNEEYHAASLVGLTLASAIALEYLSGTAFRRRLTEISAAFFIILFFLLYVFPARTFAHDQLQAGNDIRTFVQQRHGKYTLLICDSQVAPLRSAGLKQIELLKIAERFDSTELEPAALLARLTKEIQPLLEEQNRVLLAGQKCDLRYLARRPGPQQKLAAALSEISLPELFPGLSSHPTGISIPLNWYTQYDPVSWRYADLYELRREAPEKPSK